MGRVELARAVGETRVVGEEYVPLDPPANRRSARMPVVRLLRALRWVFREAQRIMESRPWLAEFLRKKNGGKVNRNPCMLI